MVQWDEDVEAGTVSSLENEALATACKEDTLPNVRLFFYLLTDLSYYLILAGSLLIQFENLQA